MSTEAPEYCGSSWAGGSIPSSSYVYLLLQLTKGSRETLESCCVEEKKKVEIKNELKKTRGREGAEMKASIANVWQGLQGYPEIEDD